TGEKPMTENKTKPEPSTLETVEQNLKTAINAWNEEINVSELPKAMQRKHRVVKDKISALMFDVHQYLTTERRVGRPAGGLTKTVVRNEIKNATPEQLAAIAKILVQKPETEIPPVSADVENSEGVNEE
ncbi:MAG: hypothetical protein PHV87_08100, partial [Bacilli bacterium]|nr:hypothetical protein [Bacilli bacterium]